MHEFSIAQALADVVRQQQPADTTVETVCITVGPMRGIEPSAMDWAWAAVIEDTDLAGATLKIQQTLWQVHCPQCDKRWEAKDVFVTCECGCDNVHPDGNNDELKIAYIDVNDKAKPAPAA